MPHNPDDPTITMVRFTVPCTGHGDHFVYIASFDHFAYTLALQLEEKYRDAGIPVIVQRVTFDRTLFEIMTEEDFDLEEDLPL